MSDIKLNFTGKASFEEKKEFEKFYEELWKRTPHYNADWPSDEEIENKKREYKKLYNSDSEKLENERWEPYPDDTRYMVSSLGRIKFNKKIVKQDDKNKKGYLVLVQPDDEQEVINTSTYVYTFVAKTFLGKKDGDGLHVHHIDNNGYDCSVENLILLTPEQHRAVHRSRKLNKEQLKDFLNPQRRYSEERIKLHLSDYKVNKITRKCGTWNNGKFYTHILPTKEDNLIGVSYEENLKKLYADIDKENGIHKYFAHLTSSQALCFNLFYPLCMEKYFNLIDKRCTEATKFAFEHVEENSFEKCSNPKDKTNFDFFMICDAAKFFFEVKYTEETFGYVPSVLDGDRHDKKYRNYYKAQMEKIAPSVDKKGFFDNYQLWRNICHVTEGEVYFVCLKYRTDLIQDVEDAKKLCLKDYRVHIHVLKIEDLVKKALEVKNDKLHNHYLEFFEKYLNY